MLKFTIDWGRSDPPNLITFKEFPNFKITSSLNLNFKYNKVFQNNFIRETQELYSKYKNLILTSNKNNLLIKK